MDILLDTNAILAIFNYKKDIFSLIRAKYDNVKFYTTKGVINELKAIANDPKRSRTERNYAKFALKIIEMNNVKIIEIDKKVDDVLAELSNKFVIFTLDKDLKRRIRKRGGYLLELRGGKLYTNYYELI